MYKIPTISKPAEPTCIWNAVIAAKIRGRYFSDVEGGISFRSHGSFLNPDSAPRGQGNPRYTASPTLQQLDPSCLMAIAEETSLRNPVGSVGYTATHRGIKTLSALSSQFMRWFKVYQTVYLVASAAQKKLRAGDRTLLDSTREARYTDGDVEAFLLATGEITGGVISYPTGQEIDVDSIYNSVVSFLTPLISILDNEGAGMGELACKDAIGMGVMPKVGAPMAFIDAASFDALYRAPWRKALMNSRVLEMVEPQLVSRLAAATADPAIAEGDFLTIVEGDDSLLLPAAVPVGFSGSLFEYIVSQLSHMQQLSTGDYLTGDEWHHQFYTSGDLLEAILVSETVDPLTNSMLSVLLGNVSGEWEDDHSIPAGDGFAVLTDHVASTGALSSYNLNANLGVNMINGSIDVDFIDSGELVNPRGDGSVTSMNLPNGILYLGDCSQTTAINWINILRWLENSLPMEVRLIMETTGRAKRTLPSLGSAKIASSETTLGMMNYAGTRDGFKLSLSPAFNVKRATRVEQEGPVMMANLPDAAMNVETTPYPLAGSNNWDVSDDSPGINATNHMGVTSEIEAPPARFTGQWNSGRFSTWTPAVISATASTGAGSTSNRIAANLLSLPKLSNLGNYESFRYSGTAGEKVALMSSLVDQASLIALYDGAGFDGAWQVGAASMEHNHLEYGFMRGLANRFPQAWSDSAIDSWSIDDGGVRVGGDPTRDNGILLLSQVYYNRQLDVDDMYVRTVSDDGYGFKNSSGAMPFGSSFMWDPTRAQITGLDWKRWAGDFFQDILPHPFAPNPIVVSTAYMTVTDINTRVLLPTQRIVGAVAVRNVEEILPGDPTYLSDGQTRIYAQDNTDSVGRKVPFTGCQYGVTVTGFSDRSPSMLGGGIARSINGGNLAREAGSDGKINSSVAPLFQIYRDDLHAIPPFTVNISVMNGMTRGKINNITGLGMNSTEKSTVIFGTDPCLGDIATPVDDFHGGYRIPVRYSGENHCNVGSGAAPAVAMVIDGVGILPENDAVSYDMFRPFSWLYGSYNGEEVITSSPTVQDYCVYYPLAPYMALHTGNVGASTQPANTPLEYWNLFSVRVGPLSTVSNRWFAKGGNLSRFRAWMRNRDLVNPWIRGEGQSGIVHLLYDVAEVTQAYDGFRKGTQSLGQKLNVGLDNSKFLEVQQAN